MTLNTAHSDTAADLGLTWNHGFAALGPSFYTELRPPPCPRRIGSAAVPMWRG